MILDEVHKLGKEYLSIRLREVSVSKGKSTATYLFSCPFDLNSQQLQRIDDIVKSYTPTNLKIVIQFVLDKLSEQSLKKYIINYLEKNYHTYSIYLSTRFSVVYLDNQYITEFDANQTIYESLTKSKFLATITSYFNSFTSFKCIFRLKATEEDTPLAELIEKVQVFDQLAVNKELSKPQRFINISDKKILLGKLIVGKPKYITDLENEDTFYVICGTVDNKESKFSKNNAEMLVVKFELSDFSGSMRIIYFAKTEKKQRKLLALSNGDEVLVYGKLVNNKFSNQTELIAYDINRCKIVAEEQQLNCKLVPEKYLVVSPQRVSKVLQKSFVAQDITEKKIENEFLLSNSVVVFDIETTGLNHLQEKIIEIGAVKLVKGIVTETFSTLVNPEIHISDKIQELTHITDYMVINAPTISEVMGDFYKFCSDSSVTGYNVVDFDMKFIRYYATPCGYFFKNYIFDVMELSRNYFANNSYLDKKPANYKLATVANILEVNNVEAHRALGDAQTTAHMLIKLLSLDCKLL